MKYYKNTETGEVFAYETEAEREEWGAPELTEMTPEEVEDHLNPKPTLEQAKALRVSRINASFEQAASALTDGYPEAERATWPTQQAEALAWGEDPNLPTPYLDGLAAARGITPEEMRQKTLTQTQLFMSASQALVGKRQRLRDLVHEAQTTEDLEAIHWDDPPAA